MPEHCYILSTAECSDHWQSASQKRKPLPSGDAILRGLRCANTSVHNNIPIFLGSLWKPATKFESSEERNDQFFDADLPVLTVFFVRAPVTSHAFAQILKPKTVVLGIFQINNLKMKSNKSHRLDWMHLLLTKVVSLPSYADLFTFPSLCHILTIGTSRPSND